MYQTIEIWLQRFVEFQGQGGEAKIHQIVMILGRRPFLAKNLFKQILHGGKGPEASVNRGLYTDCLTRIKTKGLNISIYITLISTCLICIQNE